MKTLEQILETAPVYAGLWSDKVDVISDFNELSISKSEYEAVQPPYANEKLWLEKKRTNVKSH